MIGPEAGTANFSAAIYQWYTSSDYLIRALLPSAHLFDASVDDDVKSIVDRLSPDVDLFVFHINCTHTEHFPRGRTALVRGLAQLGLEVINGGLTDISKRTLQHHCVRLGIPATGVTAAGDPDEMIIVKTDLNYGGASEWGLSEAEMKTIRLKGRSELIYEPGHYRILPRHRVPEEWWSDRRLFIGRFISNPLNRWYRIFLMFRHLVICELVSADRIKKVASSHVVSVSPVVIRGSEVHGDIGEVLLSRLAVTAGRLADALGMDFGAVDVVEDDKGHLYPIDANSTPAWGVTIPGVLEHLREALRASQGEAPEHEVTKTSSG